MSNESYDLIVIGAGPGGYLAAIRAAQLGMHAACVEKGTALGGTCLNVGCIPSKALLDSSERYHQAKAGLGAHGIVVGSVELDLAAMMARKDKVVEALTRGVASLFRKHKIDWIRGTARLTAADTVQVDGEAARVMRAPRVLVATGSAPSSLPHLPFDGTHIISSTEALCLPKVPARMLVVGGGAIGLEMGSVWRRLGAEVLVVELMDHIVPGMDGQMSVALQRALKKQGISFRLRASVKHAEKTAAGVRVIVEGEGTENEETCDVVLVAVGRRPYTEGLGLREVGVTTDAHGRIPVDERYATSVRGIFAIGDVISGPMLAHKAGEEGIAAVELMAGVPAGVNYAGIPNIVYTWPELASVGLTEEEARRRGHELRVGSFSFLGNGRARCMNETDGSIKVIAAADTDAILGIHILGPHASELIAEAALAMQFEARVEDIARAVHAHPTLAEALKEAALDVAGRSLHR